MAWPRPADSNILSQRRPGTVGTAAVLRRLAVVLAAAAALSASLAGAGGGPQQVALVVNPDDVDSLTVANYYVAMHGIPSSNVILIPWRPNVQRMSGKAFRDDMLQPVLAAIKQRGLQEQIDTIAYSCGFPYFVDFAKGFDGQSAAPADRAAMSLNAATYLYTMVMESRRDAFALSSNSYFAPTVGGNSPSRAFDATQQWGPGGRPVERGGRRHYLSTLLGVTYGRGNSVDEIVEYLKRAKLADGSSPAGVVYYMRNANVRSRTRHNSFPAVIAALNNLGVAAKLLEGRQPNNRLNIAGLTTGATHVNVLANGGRFVPGALVDNLTSAGGALQIPKNPKPQTPVSQYLREGATGASGTIIEPFAIGAKFPNAFLHVHYARGCSLAEAFYLSVKAPYQLLIVGDPLCRPWAKIPQVELRGVAKGSSISGTVQLEPSATVEGGAGIARFEAYVDGALVASSAPRGDLSFNTEQLASGWRRLRVVAIDDTPIATQGSWTGVVEVNNNVGVVQLSSPGGERLNYGASVELDVRASQPGETTLLHMGREIGRASEGLRQVQIAAEQLGKGPVFIEARQNGPHEIVARPLQIWIE